MGTRIIGFLGKLNVFRNYNDFWSYYKFNLFYNLEWACTNMQSALPISEDTKQNGGRNRSWIDMGLPIRVNQCNTPKLRLESKIVWSLLAQFEIALSQHVLAQCVWSKESRGMPKFFDVVWLVSSRRRMGSDVPLRDGTLFASVRTRVTSALQTHVRRLVRSLSALVFEGKTRELF